MYHSSRSTRQHRPWTSLAVVVGLSSFLLAGPADQRVGAQGASKVEPALLQAVAADGEAVFWVYLEQKADLSQAETITD
jgi:hypothetical protein